MLKNPLKVSSEIPVEFEAPAEKSQYKTDLGEKITFQVGESRSGRTTRGKHGCCDLSPSPTRLHLEIFNFLN
jgi:hypothetical protein